jgi:ABC-type lipoprotein release transport system permease subunit
VKPGQITTHINSFDKDKEPNMKFAAVCTALLFASASAFAPAQKAARCAYTFFLKRLLDHD